MLQAGSLGVEPSPLTNRVSFRLLSPHLSHGGDTITYLVGSLGGVGEGLRKKEEDLGRRQDLARWPGPKRLLLENSQPQPWSLCSLCGGLLCQGSAGGQA